MKIRKLHFFQRNIQLALSLIILVAFASCSRSVTSLRSSDKLQNQQALTKPSQTAIPQTAIVPPKLQPAADLQKDAKAEVAQTTEKHKFSKWSNANAKFIFQKSALVKNTVIKTVDNQMASIKSLTKNNRQMSDNHSAQPTRDMIRTGIMCIIISLILYLIAWLLFFADPISTLFYVLASIFLVVGIIFLLFGLLGMM